MIPQELTGRGARDLRRPQLPSRRAGRRSTARCSRARRPRRSATRRRSRNVPVTPVMSPAELVASEPHARPRHLRRPRPSTAATGVLPAGYFEFDDRASASATTAPEPGADTEDVRGALGRRPSRPSPSRGSRSRRAPEPGQRPARWGCASSSSRSSWPDPRPASSCRDQGADVIRVESRAFPDQSRVFGGEANMSSQFVTINRNKRSLGIDLRAPEGRELILRLMAVSDVVIENLGPGALDNLGLDLQTLRAANPRIVVVSSQLFGDRGPWGWWRGFGTHARSVGGADVALALSRHRPRLRREPHLLPRPVRGPARPRSRRWPVSATAVDATSVSRRPMRWSTTSPRSSCRRAWIPVPSTREGNRSPLGAPWGVYPSAGDDQWCVITVRDDQEWSAFVAGRRKPRVGNRSALRHAGRSTRQP